MSKMTRIFRSGTTDEQAKIIARRLKAIEYELIDIVTGGSNAAAAPMNLSSADWLARMQRDLRGLRLGMEVERRFDTGAGAMPRGWSRTLDHPWGPARGGKRDICDK